MFSSVLGAARSWCLGSCRSPHGFVPMGSNCPAERWVPRCSPLPHGPGACRSVRSATQESVTCVRGRLSHHGLCLPCWAPPAGEVRVNPHLLFWFQKSSKRKKKKHKKEKEERSKDKKKKSKKKQPPSDEAAEPVENGALDEEPLPVRGTSLASRGPAKASARGESPAGSRSCVPGPAGSGASARAGEPRGLQASGRRRCHVTGVPKVQACVVRDPGRLLAHPAPPPPGLRSQCFPPGVLGGS